jgi:hypothetical protein
MFHLMSFRLLLNRDLIVPVMADLIGHLSDYQMPGLGRA